MESSICIGAIMTYTRWSWTRQTARSEHSDNVQDISKSSYSIKLYYLLVAGCWLRLSIATVSPFRMRHPFYGYFFW
jgi:hypothetical protein